MDKIVTQDLEIKFYNLIAKYDTCLAHTDEQITFCEKNCSGHGCPIQKELAKECAELFTGMIVLTKEQFEKAIGDAFDAGKNGFKYEEKVDTNTYTVMRSKDKQQYIATLLNNNK